jgi:hypothetical protein
MSLAGYSLVGWSPPEPTSASPARKIEFEFLTWIDLHALKNAGPQAATLSLWLARKARSAASKYATNLRATASVARLPCAPFCLALW